MPPLRTPLARTVPPTKAVKSERTHEENQERAYIAASRRSDRSLEARVESARRASEIHKRRTGRALRVTESDVLNEEMYEEEDDEYSHQFRNLSLMMSNGPMDRRFAAYYQHQMTMRQIVDRALQDRMAHAGQVVNYPPNNIYPSPYMMPQQPFYQHMQPASPYMQQQPGFRQQPYAIPNALHAQGRSMSVHVPATQRHMTSPPHIAMNPQNPLQSAAQVDDSAIPRRQSAPVAAVGSPATAKSESTPNPYPSPSAQSPSPTPCNSIQPPPSDVDHCFNSIYPFTAEMPPESSRFLQGQMQSGFMPPFGNMGSPEVLSGKGYTTVHKGTPVPLIKGEEPITPATEGLGWQPKLEVPLSDVSTNVAPSQDVVDSLFGDSASLMMPSEGPIEDFKYSDMDSLNDGLFGETFDPESWDKFMNQDWLDSSSSS